MKKYILIDHDLNFSCICDTKETIIEACGYDSDEITFDNLLLEIGGTYEIIEFEGEINWVLSSE